MESGPVLPCLRRHADASVSAPWFFESRWQAEHGIPLGLGSDLFEVLLSDEPGGSLGPGADSCDVSIEYYEDQGVSTLGGFFHLTVVPYPACGRPMRLEVHIHREEVGDFFDDFDELILLACDRTARCPGLDGGTIVLERM